MNVILINNKISNYEIFNESKNDNTQSIIFDPSIDTYQSIIDKITNLNNKNDIINIALVSHGVRTRMNFKLLDNEAEIKFRDYLNREDPFQSWNDFIQFLNNIKNQLTNLENFDFLGCATVKYPEWKKVFKSC